MVTDWICANAPTPTSSASETQQWALVAGLALRDIYAGNECEPDSDAEVPGGGPDHLRVTASLLSDTLEIILPLCTTSHHPGGDILDIDPHSARTGPVSHKSARIMGKRGKPPGIRATKTPAPSVGVSNAATAGGTSSAEEVEMAVTGKIGSSDEPAAPLVSSISRAGKSGQSAARRARQLAQVYVELTVPPKRRSSAAPSHQIAPADDVPPTDPKVVPPPTKAAAPGGHKKMPKKLPTNPVEGSDETPNRKPAKTTRPPPNKRPGAKTTQPPPVNPPGAGASKAGPSKLKDKAVEDAQEQEDVIMEEQPDVVADEDAVMGDSSPPLSPPPLRRSMRHK